MAIDPRNPLESIDVKDSQPFRTEIARVKRQLFHLGEDYEDPKVLWKYYRNMAARYGDGFVITRRQDGTLWSWGCSALDGQLGQDSVTPTATPTQVSGDIVYSRVFAPGRAHTIALDVSGAPYAWGDNQYGQLGNGSGTGTGYFDGADRLTVPNSANWDFGTGDFTIETWIYHFGTWNAISSLEGLIGSGNGTAINPSDNGWRFMTGSALFQFNANGAVGYLLSSITIPQDQWTHLAVSRVGNTAYMFIDGALVDSTDVTAVSFNSVGSGLVIGRFYLNYDGHYLTDALMDDTRISKGTGRYTTSFTPERFFTNDVDTSLLIKFEDFPFTDSSDNLHTISNVGVTQQSTFGVFESSPVATLSPSAGLFGTTAAAGWGHSLMIDQDDNIGWAWGWNSSGQLGDGTTIDRPSPVEITLGSSGERFRKIDAGDEHSIGLDQRGQVWGWGRNFEGQLGVPGSPISISGVTDVLTPDSFDDFSAPLGSGFGTYPGPYTFSSGFFCRYNTICADQWEHGQEGEQFGIAHELKIIDPVAEFGGSAPKFGTQGARERHSGGLTWVLTRKFLSHSDQDILILVRMPNTKTSNLFSGVVGRVQDVTQANKTFYRFGFNGTNGEGCSLEKYVGAAYTQIALVNGASLQFCVENPTANNCPSTGWDTGEWWWARLRIQGTSLKGKIWPYGWNMPVGWDIDLTDSSITGSGDWGIAAEWAATDNWGHFFDWAGVAIEGREVINSISYGTSGSTTPTKPVSAGFDDHGGLMDVAVGSMSSYGIDVEGQAWAWGDNTYGQLGDDSTTNKTTPTEIAGRHSFIQIAAGGRIEEGHACALKPDGSVWCFGRNHRGQLGVCDEVDRSSPVSVVGNHSFIDISVSKDGFQTIAIKADGSVWVWGKDPFCDDVNYCSPVSVPDFNLILLNILGRGYFKNHSNLLRFS